MFEKEKNEIGSDVDRLETEHGVQLREVRNQQIDAEVETRRLKAEQERVFNAINGAEQEFTEKVVELTQKKK